MRRLRMWLERLIAALPVAANHLANPALRHAMGRCHLPVATALLDHRLHHITRQIHRRLLDRCPRWSATSVHDQLKSDTSLSARQGRGVAGLLPRQRAFRGLRHRRSGYPPCVPKRRFVCVHRNRNVDPDPADHSARRLTRSTSSPTRLFPAPRPESGGTSPPGPRHRS